MNESPAVDSQLFVLRVWVEVLGEGRFEIRGQVKHIQTGETAYFREWSDLLTFLTRRLQVGEAIDDLGDVPGTI